MRTLGAILGGSIGGIIGAVVWALVTFYSGYEIGWIAWGIGGLVGFGVHLGTRGRGGIGPGGTAAIIALAAVVGGKWAAVRIELSAYMGDNEAPTSIIADIVIAEREEAGSPAPFVDDDAESIREMYPPDVWNEAVQRWEAMDPEQQDAVRAIPQLANPQVWLVWLADEVVEEFERDGRAVDWPAGMDVDSAWRETHYPADVWAEAVTRWDAMSEPERETHEASVTRHLEQGMALGEQEMLTWGFMQSLSLFDILWVGLAVVTAAKLGAGQLQAVSEDPPPA